MKREERGWFVLVLLVVLVLSYVVYHVWGMWGYLAWIVLCALIGCAMGTIFRRRDRRAKVEEWRSTHPGLSDYWLPKDLRSKS